MENIVVKSKATKSLLSDKVVEVVPAEDRVGIVTKDGQVVLLGKETAREVAGKIYGSFFSRIKFAFGG